MLNAILILPKPLNYFIICSLITIIASIGLPFLGNCMDKLVALMMKGLTNVTNSKFAFFMINRFTFIGTVLHELAHAFFAKIFGAKITKISLFDFFKSDTLGHVEFVTRGGFIRRNLQLFFSSVAPVLVNTFFIFLLVINWVNINTWYFYIIFIYLILSLFIHASMSSQDLKLYRKGSIVAIPVIIILSTLVVWMFSPVI